METTYCQERELQHYRSVTRVDNTLILECNLLQVRGGSQLVKLRVVGDDNHTDTLQTLADIAIHFKLNNCAEIARYLATCLSQPYRLLWVSAMCTLAYLATCGADAGIVVTVKR